jgi:hypothetical protein
MGSENVFIIYPLFQPFVLVSVSLNRIISKHLFFLFSLLCSIAKTYLFFWSDYLTNGRYFENESCTLKGACKPLSLRDTPFDRNSAQSAAKGAKPRPCGTPPLKRGLQMGRKMGLLVDWGVRLLAVLSYNLY